MGTRRRMWWRPAVAIAGTVVVVAASQGVAWATGSAVTDEVIPGGDVSGAVAVPVDGAVVEDVVDAVDEAVDNAQTTVADAVDTAETATETTVEPASGTAAPAEDASGNESLGSAPDASGTPSNQNSSASSGPSGPGATGPRIVSSSKQSVRETTSSQRVVALAQTTSPDRKRDTVEELVSIGHEIPGQIAVSSRVEGSAASDEATQEQHRASVASRLAHTGINALGFLLLGLVLVGFGGGARTTAARAQQVPIAVG